LIESSVEICTSPGAKCVRWMLCARNISSGNGSANNARTSTRVQSWRGSASAAAGVSFSAIDIATP